MLFFSCFSTYLDSFPPAGDRYDSSDSRGKWDDDWDKSKGPFPFSEKFGEISDKIGSTIDDTISRFRKKDRDDSPDRFRLETDKSSCYIWCRTERHKPCSKYEEKGRVKSENRKMKLGFTLKQFFITEQTTTSRTKLRFLIMLKVLTAAWLVNTAVNGPFCSIMVTLKNIKLFFKSTSQTCQ